MANRDTAVVVRELFRGARSSVLVAGYAVYQGREVFRALAERMAEVSALRVRLFLDVHRQPGDDAPDDVLLTRFAHRFRQSEWPGEAMPEVFYDPRSLAADAVKRSSLHAKCVVVDQETAFVSSANFTEAAQVRNIEVGVLVQSPAFAARLSQQFETLAAVGLLQPLRIAP
jgi:phosphatidylserine/phosphatidylglycerophosphate/cardiolipin synthase-like enzyme